MDQLNQRIAELYSQLVKLISECDPETLEIIRKLSKEDNGRDDD